MPKLQEPSPPSSDSFPSAPDSWFFVRVDLRKSAQDRLEVPATNATIVSRISAAFYGQHWEATEYHPQGSSLSSSPFFQARPSLSSCLQDDANELCFLEPIGTLYVGVGKTESALLSLSMLPFQELPARYLTHFWDSVCNSIFAFLCSHILISLCQPD